MEQKNRRLANSTWPSKRLQRRITHHARIARFTDPMTSKYVTRKCIVRRFVLLDDIIKVYNMKEVAYMVESDNAATRNNSASSSNNNCRGPSLVEQSKS